MRGATAEYLEHNDYIRISIHAPHAGSDGVGVRLRFAPSLISIHAPHAGSDILFMSISPFCLNFNPRSPCGERHC